MDNVKEKEMENFTASFLLAEFRKDNRELRAEFSKNISHVESKIDATNQRIDNNFKWTLGLIFLMTFSIISVVLVK